MSTQGRREIRRRQRKWDIHLQVVAFITFTTLAVATAVDTLQPGQHLQLVDACMRCFTLGFGALLAMLRRT